MALLDGCYWKVARSLQHLDALNQSRQGFIEKEGQLTFSFSGKANSQRTQYLFRVGEVMNDLPLMDWGIILGDAIHCLRSTLDQMVYAVATDPTRDCGFPIYSGTEHSGRKKWAIESPGLLVHIPEDVQAVIEAHQPYHRGDSAHSHPLAFLRELSNLDKHRTIPTTTLSSVGATGQIIPDSVVGVERFWGLTFKNGVALETEAVIATVSIEPDDSGAEPYMHMDSHFEFDVAFGKGPIPASLISNQSCRRSIRLGGASFPFSTLSARLLSPTSFVPTRWADQRSSSIRPSRVCLPCGFVSRPRDGILLLSATVFASTLCILFSPLDLEILETEDRLKPILLSVEQSSGEGRGRIFAWRVDTQLPAAGPMTQPCGLQRQPPTTHVGAQRPSRPGPASPPAARSPSSQITKPLRRPALCGLPTSFWFREGGSLKVGA